MTNTTRLAFWGRVSTEDNQDIESSRGWQLTRARTLTEPRGGQIVAEYFDIDKSRSIPPARRPQAAALLAALADPNRGFEAVVVGEPHTPIVQLAAGASIAALWGRSHAIGCVRH